MRLRRFEELRPGDIITSLDDVARWIGSVTWYAGLFVTAGTEMTVTDIYHSGCRVVAKEGGIHYFFDIRTIRKLNLIRHSKPLSDDEALREKPNILCGSWPRYDGSYRVGMVTTPKIRTSRFATRLQQEDFATLAKAGNKRQSGKTGKTKTKNKTKR